MDAFKLRKLYEAGNRDFVDLNLSGANLVFLNLSGANLSGADLSESILVCANLSGANLSGANLSSADLCSANLSGANLINADLTCINGIQVNLSYSDLINVKLSCANLKHADLSSAILSDTDLSETNLSKADLSDADLSRANLIGANLFDTDLTNTNLSEALLDGTIQAYQRVSEELQQENQKLRENLSLFETQFENRVAKEVDKRTITNQGIKGKKKLTWQDLRFKSEPEMKIAQALDERGILFFPLASGRVMTEEGMITREVDFLICSEGLWGILECDSEVFHPSAAIDHKRDNNYKRHSVWFIQRFSDKECKKNPQKVVGKFLDMLKKFHEDQRYLITGKSTERISNASQQTHIS